MTFYHVREIHAEYDVLSSNGLKCNLSLDLYEIFLLSSLKPVYKFVTSPHILMFRVQVSTYANQHVESRFLTMRKVCHLLHEQDLQHGAKN